MLYNSAMTIVVSGSEKAVEAIKWCEQNIGKSGWALHANHDIFSEKYHFRFDDQKNATHFALKWR